MARGGDPEGGSPIVQCGSRGHVGDDFGWGTGNKCGLSGGDGQGDIRYRSGGGTTPSRGLRGRRQRRRGCDGPGRLGVVGRGGQTPSSEGIGGGRGQSGVREGDRVA